MRHGLLVSVLLGVMLSATATPAAAQDVYLEQRPVPDAQVYVVSPQPAPQLRLVQPQPAPPVVVVAEPAAPQVQIVQHQQAPLLLRREPAPSFLRYSAVGFFSGALVGLGVGYLVTSGSYGGPDWRPLVLASGIGALTGAGLGLGLAFLDAASDSPLPPARYVMRDAAYGTLLGGLFGATVGGLVALNSGEAKDVLLGSAIGGISGFVLGGLVGVLEGRLRGREARVVASLSVAPDAAGRQVFAPTIAGRF